MKAQHHMEDKDHAVEALLRQYLLEDKTENRFKTKLMDMTAEMVWGTAPTYTPAPEREKELLDRLYKDIHRRPNLRRGLWLFLLMLLGIASYLIIGRLYTQNIENEYISRKNALGGNMTHLPSRPPVSPASALAIPAQKSVTKAKPRIEIKLIPFYTGGREKPAVEHSPMYSQPGLLSDEGNYTKQDWESFNVSWKASPERYEKKSGAFLLDTMRQPFNIAHTHITHDYYSGMPLKKMPDDMVYINFGEQLQLSSKKEPYMFTPCRAMRFYLDTAATEVNPLQLTIKDVPQVVLDRMLEPFYFRKYEVTNAEYRAFLAWTARHNGSLGDGQPFSMHVPAGKVEEEFAYTFHNTSGSELKGLPSKTINVFPDTSAFIKDFNYMNGDSMVYKIPQKTYFSDPSYSDRPVCGITYWQALAYLDWLTYFYQDYFDRNHIPYKITFSLPTDIEWEMAASLVSYMPGKQEVPASNYVYDDDWVCSLKLSMQHGSERFYALDKLLDRDVIYEGNYIEDGYFYPGPADLGVRKKTELNEAIGLHHDQFGISWMDNNVSEWMQESYQDNWLPMYTKHQRILQESGKEQDNILAMIETYFNARNAKDGRLVRGGNFYDERFSLIQDKNMAGIMLKRFVSPDEDHSTIGFRYVVRIEKR